MAALFGPCTSPNQKYFKNFYNYENWSWFVDNNIFVIDGPNWEEVRAKIFGTNDGPKNPAPQSIQDNIAVIEHLENNPTQAMAAYAQTSISNRFQRYNKNWFSEPNEVPKTELMDFGRVKKMKVAMYVGLFDDTCPLTVAQEQYTQMGPEIVANWVVAPWQGHVLWGFSAQPWLVENVAQSLMINADLPPNQSLDL